MTTAAQSTIISTAKRLSGLQRTLSGRIRFAATRTEQIDLLINTNYILTVLLDSVELQTTEVDQALVECTEAIRWLNLALKDQLRFGD